METNELSAQDLLTQFEIRYNKTPYMPSKDNRKDLGFSLSELRKEIEERLWRLEDLSK